jgi:signal transduction histidine kinase
VSAPAVVASIEAVTAEAMIEAPTEPGPIENSPPAEKAAVAKASPAKPAAPEPRAEPIANAVNGGEPPRAARRRHPLRFVWQIDAEGRFAIGSDEFIALIGPQTAAALGRPWHEVAATLGLDPERHLARNLGTHDTWSGLLVAWPVDDSVERLTVELSGLPVFDRNRTFRGYRGFGVCRDLARLTALARSRLGAAIEPAHPEGEEPSAGSLSAEQVVSFPSASPTEAKAPSLSPVERHAFRELARRLTERLSGAGVEDETEGAPDTDPQVDAVLAADATLSDLEAAKAVSDPVLQEDLREHDLKATSAKSDLLAKISHEIRTPLTAIIGFSEAMMEERFGPVGNDRYRQYLKDIHASGGHLISLINDLLDLSKIEVDKLELAFTNVALNDLTQQCVAIMQPQANHERIIIRTSLSPKLPQVVADARSVRQIVLNLISNSIKFTGAGGQVIVSTALTDLGEVVLRVRDTGVSMSENEVTAALEPFRQLATSTRFGSGATDLGLPLTKALAEANRASFRINSKPSAGTLVEISFPSTCLWAE